MKPVILLLFFSTLGWAQVPSAPPGISYSPKDEKEKTALDSVRALTGIQLKAERRSLADISLRARIKVSQDTVNVIQSRAWVHPVQEAIDADKVLAGKITAVVQMKYGGHQVRLDLKGCTSAEVDSLAAMVARMPLPLDWEYPDVYVNGPGFARYTMPAFRDAISSVR